MRGPKILYGMRCSEFVHIGDAARGQACSCTCPSCGRNLIARKGEVLRPPSIAVTALKEC